MWQRTNPEVVARVCLGLLLAASAVIVVFAIKRQWFIYDEFDYLAPPEGSNWLGWLIRPHNEHTILFTKLWFSTLFRFVGLHGYWLYAIPMIVGHLAGAVAVYRLLRLVVPFRSIAVAAVAPVLVMAAGAGTLTWAGQFQYTAATAAGLWVLYCVLDQRIRPRTQLILVIVLSLFGTFSGSAYIPLGVAAGFAALSLRRYYAGILAVAIPSIWFVLSRILWTVPTQNSAHSVEQILAEGPQFIYALLNKAVSDSIPIDGESFTPAIIVVAALLCLAFLSSKPVADETILQGTPVPSARRVYLFLLLALILSLAITTVGRLSRNLEESASGGYSYFIMIAAIPIFVASVSRFVSSTRSSRVFLVATLIGWGLISMPVLQQVAEDLGSWKSENAILLTGAAALDDRGLDAYADAQPSPDLAPTVSWAELRDMAQKGSIPSIAPSESVADQLSLNVQWSGLAEGASLAAAGCVDVKPNDSTTIDGGGPVQVITEQPSTFTLSYETSAASRSFSLSGQLVLESLSKRSATITAGSEPLQVCSGL